MDEIFCNTGSEAQETDGLMLEIACFRNSFAI